MAPRMDITLKLISESDTHSWLRAHFRHGQPVELMMLLLALLLEHLGNRSPPSPGETNAGRIMRPEMLMTILLP